MSQKKISGDPIDVKSKDIKEPPILTISQIEDTEKQLIDRYLKGSCYLLVNNINGTSVEAVFRSHTDAIRYMIRIGTNFCAETYQDYIRDVKKDGGDISKENFCEYTREFINDYYHIHQIDHIDPSKRVYMMQSYNYMVYGGPTEYLTNSQETWRAKQPERNRRSDKISGQILDGFICELDGFRCESDGWMKDCTVKVDPELPDLEEIEEEKEEEENEKMFTSS